MMMMMMLWTWKRGHHRIWDWNKDKITIIWWRPECSLIKASHCILARVQFLTDIGLSAGFGPAWWIDEVIKVMPWTTCAVPTSPSPSHIFHQCGVTVPVPKIRWVHVLPLKYEAAPWMREWGAHHNPFWLHRNAIVSYLGSPADATRHRQAIKMLC